MNSSSKQKRSKEEGKGKQLTDGARERGEAALSALPFRISTETVRRGLACLLECGANQTEVFRRRCRPGIAFDADARRKTVASHAPVALARASRKSERALARVCE